MLIPTQKYMHRKKKTNIHILKCYPQLLWLGYKCFLFFLIFACLHFPKKTYITFIVISRKKKWCWGTEVKEEPLLFSQDAGSISFSNWILTTRFTNISILCLLERSLENLTTFLGVDVVRVSRSLALSICCYIFRVSLCRIGSPG